MAEIDTVNTFVDGDVVNAAALNNIIDQATAQNALITGQPVATPVPAADYVLFWDASGGTGGSLKKCTIDALPSGVTSVSMTVAPTSIFSVSVGTPATTPAIALSLDSQGPNKFLAGPTSGGATTPTFRVLNPADLPTSTVTIAALDINWDLGSMFIKQLTANMNFTFSNASDGQTIRVLLYQDGTGGRTVNWPGTTKWPGGTNPVMTPHGIDIYTFHLFVGTFYGTFQQNFLV